ncbi:MAG: heavy metal translocating P-type ATPase [Pseudobdellovibrionaceae bacterium]
MESTFSYLDQSQFRLLYREPQNPRRMKFFIEGIRCAKCISKVEGLRRQNPEIETLEVDLDNSTAWVELTSEKGSFGGIAQAISNLGYRPIPIFPGEDVTEQWKFESRKDLSRLGIAAFCAGNIMMLAFATYFGLVGTMKSQFEWLQFVLYLPVVTYVAFPFYQGFIRGLRSQFISIDGPMAIASGFGFLTSSWNLIRGQGSVYFDSLSGFLFLILATRYLQKRTRFEYLKFLKPSSLTQTFKARLLTRAGETWVRTESLRVNDQILVATNEWVPADGILLSSEAVIDLSVLNGEPLPRRVQQGFPIKAGTRLLSSAISLEVKRAGSQTFLSHLLSTLKRENFDESDSSKLSDKASKILLGSVLILALGVLISGAFSNFEAQFEKALALIILACPCAMAFGTPLAFSFSMKRAQESGILVKSAVTFEKLKSIQTLFLDKTGTLTERFWNVQNSNLAEVPASHPQVILLLESISQHPIAFALREIWHATSIPSDWKLSELREEAGRGVSGRINGVLWSFQSFQENSQKWFGLYLEGNLVWKFQLLPVLQTGAKESVQKFLNMGFRIKLLSGDTQIESEKMAQQLGLPIRDAIGNLTPQEKAELVKSTPHSLMVGDGVNDALALQAAQVGIAVSGGVDVALQSADVLFLNEGLSSLTELMKFAAKARRQIRANLTSALVYNLIGGTCALLGWVNPFVAALLMPASSLFILASTWWGVRK